MLKTNQRTTLVTNADPTHTIVLRDQFRRAYAALWQRVEREAIAIAGRAAQFERVTDRINHFNRNLRLYVESEARRLQYDTMYGAEALINAAYLRGLRQADIDAKAIDVPVYDEPQDAIRQEDHREEIAALLGLLLADWQAIVEATIAAVQRGYAQASMAGSSTGSLTETIRAQVRKVGRNRSIGLVTTGIVGVFNSALLMRLFSHGVRQVAGEEGVEWTTAGDARVCRRCQSFASQDNGMGIGIYTIEQAMRMRRNGEFPPHVSCRCRFRGVRSGREL